MYNPSIRMPFLAYVQSLNPFKTLHLFQTQSTKTFNTTTCLVTMHFLLNKFLRLMVLAYISVLKWHFSNSIIFFGLLLVVYSATLYFKTRPKKIYLLDFACYKPDKACLCTRKVFLDISIMGRSTEQSLNFLKKVFDRSGLGDKTYVPMSLLRIPPNPCLSEARKEAEEVMFGAIDEVFEKTGLKATDIEILILNCSVFNPEPSLSSMIVNHYKLANNILSYSLGGMGCSAGVISIDLAKRLLQVHPNSYALVVTLENVSLNWYRGNDRSMLVSNCLFRYGGAAIILSNHFFNRKRAKYQLIHTVRTNSAANDKSYNCIQQKEDESDERNIGIQLSKDIVAIASETLKTNITTLGPLVLPISEQLKFVASYVGRKILKRKIKPYIPDFKLAFEHFCIHAGGRGIQDEIEKNLDLNEWHLEPSRMTLYRFGNTSSSSIWYELAYSEAKGRMKKGDRVWQIALGAGFKCNSAVWRALKTIDPTEEKKNPWIDEIHEFPVKTFF